MGVVHPQDHLGSSGVLISYRTADASALKRQTEVTKYRADSWSQQCMAEESIALCANGCRFEKVF